VNVLRVARWKDNFENNRTREMRTMAWVPVPVKLGGDGYTELIDHPNGAAHFGVWIAVLEVAAGCDIRGTLLRDSGRPHDASSISRLTRIPADMVREALGRLLEIGWLVADGCDDTAPSCGVPAPSCDEPAGEREMPAPSRVRREQNRTEQNRTETSERRALGENGHDVAPALVPDPDLERARTELAENAWMGRLLDKVRSRYPSHRFKEGTAPAALFGACRRGEVRQDGQELQARQISETLFLARIEGYAASDEWRREGGRFALSFVTFMTDRQYLTEPQPPGAQTPKGDVRRTAGGHDKPQESRVRRLA